MFKASQQTPLIPSKSQSIKPDVVSDVLPLEQIRMLIPSFTGFLDPKQTFLKMTLQMENTRGEIVPDPLCGAHSLFRNVIVRDGTNSTTLTSLEDYNAMVGMLRPFTEQTSVAHKRVLFEGVQPAPNTGGKSLYYATPTSLTGSTATAPVRITRNTQQVEVYLQLEAGLFTGEQIIPVAPLQGMRIEIDTEDPLRACRLTDLTLSKSSPTNTPTDIPKDSFERDTTDPTKIEYSYLTAHAVTSTQEGNYFAVGDKLYLSQADGTAEVEIGVITGFYEEAGKLGITFCPQQDGTNIAVDYPANSKMYYKVEDRATAYTYTKEGLAPTSVSAPSYTISDIEMLCMSVSPPDGYVKGMMSASGSATGIEMDFVDVELHRFNQVNTQGITQATIPTLSPRAKSVFCQPIPLSAYRNLSVSSFNGVPDNAREYQFVIGSELIPTRQASLQRYSQTTLKTGSALPAGQRRTEPLHLTELQKAIVNVGKPVRSLQQVSEHFSIGRGLNRYGQITDLSDTSLSIRVDYDAGAVSKIFNNYVYKLAKMTIKNGITSVVS